MPKQSYGKINQQRAQTLFVALLNFANDDLEADEKELERIRSQIQIHWQTEKKLVVRTKTRYLESLIKLTGQTVLSIDHIKTALKHLENYLGILSDHRTAQRGSDNWHFTVELWCNRWQRDGNLEAFDRSWLQKGNENPLPSKERGQEETLLMIDWHSICRQALDTNLSSNPLMTNIGKAFDLNDIYLPLGVEERRLIEEDSIHYQPTELITKLLAIETNRTAIIGTPGAGKTTLLQKVALSLLEANCLPIWISLADLGTRSLENYLTETWLKEALCTFQVSLPQQQKLVQQVESGKIWLLLDAVDEIGAASSTLTNLAKQLKGWLSQAHVVLTCRSNLWNGEKNALIDFTTYQILNFSHSHNGVEVFIDRWFHGNVALGQKLATKLKERNMDRIRSFVTNPLCLALLCRSWMLEQGQLPETKTALYRQFIDAIYSWKQDLFPTSLSQRQTLNSTLAQLSLIAMQAKESVFRLSAPIVLAAFAADLDLLTLALNLGFLTQYGQGETIYTFHHPTFQEYFAAQAIATGQQFFDLNIFDLKWREVYLLWLGRADIADQAKQELLQSLLDFEDNCGGFYRYRAYFLVAEGIAEFPTFSHSDEIVTNLVNIRYLSTFESKVPTAIVERAGIALLRTDRIRAIRSLEEFIHIPDRYSPQAIWLAAHSLGKNYDAGNAQSIATLEAMLAKPPNENSKFSLVKSLLAIVPDHQGAIDALMAIINDPTHPSLRSKAIRRLQGISQHSAALTVAFNQLQDHPLSANIEDDRPTPIQKSQRRQRKIKDSHGDQHKLVAGIIRKLATSDDLMTQIRLANHLAKYEPQHPLVLESLLHCLKTSDQKAYLKQVGESLRNLVSIDQVPLVLPLVRDIYLDASEQNMERYHESYRVLWYWSRSTTHQEFDRLWQCSPTSIPVRK
jgi:Effector-associated domain 4/NACHT domain